jgi:hypothetical protein
MLSLRLLALALTVWSWTVPQILPTANTETNPERDALDTLVLNLTLGHNGPVFLRLYGQDPDGNTLARALVYPKFFRPGRLSG